MLGEDAPDQVLVDLPIECVGDLLGNSPPAKARIALLEFLRRTFGCPASVSGQTNTAFDTFAS